MVSCCKHCPFAILLNLFFFSGTRIMDQNTTNTAVSVIAMTEATLRITGAVRIRHPCSMQFIPEQPFSMVCARLQVLPSSR